jgi:hypothetical protein
MQVLGLGLVVIPSADQRSFYSILIPREIVTSSCDFVISREPKSIVETCDSRSTERMGYHVSKEGVDKQLTEGIMIAYH